MQRVTMVRYTAKPGRADENETLARAVFDELGAASPPDIAYALFRQGDDFLHLFVNKRGDTSEALTELASFKTYAKDVAERCVNPPEATRFDLRLLSSYGL